MAVTNGHINDVRKLGMPYAMEPQLFRIDVRGRFRDVSDGAGPPFREPVLGRGAAIVDLDNDGDPDIVVTHLGRPPALLLNGTMSMEDGISARGVIDHHNTPMMAAPPSTKIKAVRSRVRPLSPGPGPSSLRHRGRLHPITGRRSKRLAEHFPDARRVDRPDDPVLGDDARRSARPG